MNTKPIILTVQAFEDFRGYLAVLYDKSVDFTICQINQGYSKKAFTLRGLHFQEGEYAQAKLVSVVRGRVLDVAVDIRRGSPTFGRHVAALLDGENKRQLFIPRGFAHGFAVLSDEAVFQYKCDNFYAPQSEGAIAWNDPDLGIDWQLPAEEAILSPKDRAHPRLKDADELFDYGIDYYA